MPSVRTRPVRRAPIACGDEPVDAVAVAVAAWITADREIVRRSANLGWDDMPLRADLQARLGLPVAVLNDADAAAWAGYLELGRPAGNLIALTLGTDVGGGVIINGELITGTHGIAGELGHLVLNPEGPACVCGARGCLATYASGTALLRQAKTLATQSPEAFPVLLTGTTIDALTGIDIARAAADPSEGPALLLEAATSIAQASALISRIIDHSTVLLAGGASGIGTPIVVAVQEALRATAPIGNVLPLPTVVLATDPDSAGAHGAAHLATALH